MYDFQTRGSRDSRTKLGAHNTIIQFHSYFSTSIHIGNPRGYFWIVLYKLLTLTTWIRAYFACTYSGTRAVFERGIIRGKSRGRRCLRNIRRKSCVPRPERKHTPFSFGIPSKVRRNVCETRNSVSSLMLANSTSDTRHSYTSRLLGYTLNITFVRRSCNLTT